jgi:hypothetical protein
MLPVTEADANIPWFPFDSRDWEQLTPAFGQLKSMVGAHGPKLIANNRTATFFDRNVHEGLLELALERGDGMYRLFDAAERQNLNIRVPLNYEEGCSIEPDYDGTWYVRRSDRLTTIPSPAMPAPAQARVAAPARLAGMMGPARSVSALQAVVARQPGPAVPPVVNLGGRPTDRDLVREEARWRLKHRQTQAKSLAAFARELRKWLEDHGEHRAKKTGEVMKADTIGRHVRPLWKEHR